MKENNTYFLCATQYSNVGDLLINKMLIDELSRYGKVFVDTKNIPTDFLCYLLEDNDNVFDVYATEGISIKSGNFPAWMTFLKKANVGLFVQNPGPIVVYPFFHIRYFYFKLMNTCLRTLRIPIYRIGSCCAAVLAQGRKIPNKGIKKSYFRSKESVKNLQKAGLGNIDFIPDMAFLLNNRVKVKDKRKIVVLSFRPIIDDRSLFEKWLKSTIEGLVGQGYNVEFCYQVKSDEQFTKELYEQFKSPNVTIRSELLWWKDLDYYADKEIVISNRLHALIIGAVYGSIPIAAVNDDAKVSKIKEVFDSSFNEELNLITNYEDDGFISHVINNKEAIGRSIRNSVIQNANICRDRIQDIFTCLVNKNPLA
ncbi:MAG: polysaccharide pyruvyl transferase family protein [Bacteroidales bacterium]|nr:polysaccharide pyruvyl transferase family protein [Candidatus Colimorpha merdihippi]